MAEKRVAGEGRMELPRAGLPVATGARTVSLSLPWGSPGRGMEIVLDRGFTYRLVCHFEAQRTTLMNTLGELSGFTIVSQSGGLLNHLTLKENLRLPNSYHGSSDSDDELERNITELLLQCGLGIEVKALDAWLSDSPSRIGRLERRLVGYARGLLSNPETLVFENLFEGLTRLEVERVQGWRRLFHRHLPFRTLLFVDLDFHGLPELDDCHSVVAPVPH